jgi:hypothetical protein
MNPVWYPVLATVGVNLLLGVFFYGKFAEKVTKLEKSDDQQWNKLSNHEGRISHIEGNLGL